MYVNPFWFGVLTTLGVELAFLFIYAIVETSRRGKR